MGSGQRAKSGQYHVLWGQGITLYERVTRLHIQYILPPGFLVRHMAGVLCVFCFLTLYYLCEGEGFIMCLPACDFWNQLISKRFRDQLVLTVDRPPSGVDHQSYGQD